jgi:predicted MFS family arabinose efflux permease
LAIKTLGWRWTYNAMGIFGIVLGAAIIVFVKEPERAPAPKSTVSPFVQFKESLTDIWKNPVSRYVTLAGMFNYIGGFAMMYYMPSFFQRVYPMYKA